MYPLRAACAALLFLAFAVGVPLRAAAACDHGSAGTEHRAHVMAAHAAPVHDHGRCCPGSHPTKAGSSALCQMVCGAAVAVLDPPVPHPGTPFSYTVRFAADPSASAQGATPAPDPFPPRPSRIA